jgi:hypothetical protein
MPEFSHSTDLAAHLAMVRAGAEIAHKAVMTLRSGGYFLGGRKPTRPWRRPRLRIRRSARRASRATGCYSGATSRRCPAAEPRSGRRLRVRRGSRFRRLTRAKRCSSIPWRSRFSNGHLRLGVSILLGAGTQYRCFRWCCDSSKLGRAERTGHIRIRAALPRRGSGIRARHHRGSRSWPNRTGICRRAARARRYEVDGGISGRLPRHHRLSHRPGRY